MVCSTINTVHTKKGYYLHVVSTHTIFIYRDIDIYISVPINLLFKTHERLDSITRSVCSK